MTSFLSAIPSLRNYLGDGNGVSPGPPPASGREQQPDPAIISPQLSGGTADTGNSLQHPNLNLNDPSSLGGEASTGEIMEGGGQQRRDDTSSNNINPADYQNSQYYCSITLSFPFDPCTFGGQDQHVFERSALIRHIATKGVMGLFRLVKHPLHNLLIPRDEAVDQIVQVSEERRNFIRCLRRLSGLREHDEEPLTEDDYRQLRETIERMADE